MKAMEKIRINIKYTRGVQPIEPIEIGDWVDLRAAEDVTIKKGECAIIPLGVAMELPEGYEAYIAPRSSTFKKFGLLCANSIGIIDNSYRGEWSFAAYAITDTKVNKNDRIAQFRIIRNQPSLEFNAVDEIDTNTARGEGGFGSTGVD